MAGVAGETAILSIGHPDISAAMVALLGDTPTMHGGAIMLAGVVTSATASDSATATLPSAMVSDSGMATLTVVTIAGSAASSAMVFPTMTIMGTTLEDAAGCTGGHSPSVALIGGAAITPVSTMPTESKSSYTT
jgi:hypothetical protein